MAGVWRRVGALLRSTSVIRGFRTSAKTMDEQLNADCLREMRKPTNFQKRTLVLAKMYKSLDEVPERISTTQLKKAQDIGRIYGTSLLIVFGAVASLVVILYSRTLRNSGQDGLGVRHQLQMDKWKAEAEKERRQKIEAADRAGRGSDSPAVAALQK